MSQVQGRGPEGGAPGSKLAGNLPRAWLQALWEKVRLQCTGRPRSLLACPDQIPSTATRQGRSTVQGAGCRQAGMWKGLVHWWRQEGFTLSTQGGLREGVTSLGWNCHVAGDHRFWSQGWSRPSPVVLRCALRPRAWQLEAARRPLPARAVSPPPSTEEC